MDDLRAKYGITPVDEPAPPGEGQATDTVDAFRNRYGIAPAEPSPYDNILSMPQFRELIGLQRQLQAAFLDPSVGDTNVLRNRIEDLRDQIISETGVSGREFDAFIRQQSELAVEVEEMPGWMRAPVQQGANVLGAAMGLVGDPLALAGDTTRTFTANLAEEQAARVERENNLPVGSLQANAKTGEFQGEPASNPITAALEMSRAAWQTTADLGLRGEPLRVEGETGRQEWNPRNGWVVYAPDIVWDRYRAGISAYEADLAVTGREFNERFNIAERLGVESEMGKELLGLGTEVLTDPWLWADWMFLGGKVLRGAGAATKSDSVINAGRRFEQAGEKMYQTLSPVGIARMGGRAVQTAARYEPTGIVSAVTKAVDAAATSVVDGLLDAPAPFPGLWMSEERRVAGGVLGWAEGELPEPRIRDLLFQRGRVEGWRNNPLEMLTGSDKYGLSAGEMALGTQRIVQGIAMRGSKRIADILTEGLRRKASMRLPWMKMSIPNANQLTPEDANFMRTMGGIISDFVSTRGVLPSGQIPAEFGARLRAAAELYGKPLEDVISRFKRAAAEARQVTLETGHELSGYRYFNEAMKTVARRMGVDYGDLRRAYEKFVGNVDVQQLERQDAFTLAPAGTTGATQVTRASRDAARNIMDGWIADPPSFNMLETQIQDELVRMGRADLRGIRPSAYLKGIRNGYLPRMFQAIEDPAAAYNALNDFSVITVRNVDPTALSNSFVSAFGKGVAKDVKRFFASRVPARQQGGRSVPATTFRSDDLATILSKRTGRTVTPDEVADIIYKDSDNYQFLKETLGLLRAPAATAPSGGSGAAGAPWAMTPGSFAARQEFDAQDLARRVLIQDPVRQIAEVGLRAGRQLRAQEFLGRVANGLQDMGLVVSKDKIPGGATPDGQQYIFPFQTDDGARYVALPDNPSVWGPLAGQAIPEDVARMVTYTASFGRKSTTDIERMLGMWRRMLISPLSTSLRNLVGNFLLIQRAGGDLSDMLTMLPEANKIRRQYNETGRLPEEFRGMEPLIATFTQDNTKTASALRGMEGVLDDIARGDSRRLNQALENAEGIVDWATTSPVAGVATLGSTGALGLFRWGEEVSRLSAFLSTYRKLAATGMDKGQAAKRAAHFASNSAFNYAATPLFPDLLRRTGASAFPQFSWFAAPRLLRAATERPATIQRAEYARQAANIVATEGDMDEQERITAMMAEWERYSKPLVIPIPGKDAWYTVNLQYWYPEGDLISVLTDPASAGSLQGFVDSVLAWTTGEGQGPFGVKFGLQVFDPSASTGTKIAQTAGYLASQYIFPGAFRTGQAINEAVRYSDNPELYELWGLSTGRFYNSTWEQFFARQLGINARRTSVKAHEQSARQRMADIERKYTRKLRPLQEKLNFAALCVNDPGCSQYTQEEFEELTQRVTQLQLEKALEERRLMEMTR